MPERRLDDDEAWATHRGRLTPWTSHELRRSHDPLVARIIELRQLEGRTLRARQDAERYNPAARRQERARRAAERAEAALTGDQRAALEQHRADLQRVLARMAGGGD